MRLCNFYFIYILLFMSIFLSCICGIYIILFDLYYVLICNIILRINKINIMRFAL